MAAVSDKPSVGDAFKLDKELEGVSAERRVQIYARCLDAYRQSVLVYEEVAPRVAFESAPARAFAEVLSRRVVAILNAYSAIIEEENPGHLFSSDFMRKMRLTKMLANSEKSSGSVGMNVLAIEKVLAEGNLRERMTLAFVGMFPQILVILDTPGLIEKINDKLNQLPVHERFQIDADLIQREKSEGIGIYDASFGKGLMQASAVSKVRDEGGRGYKPRIRVGAGPKDALSIDKIPELSEREKRVATRCSSSVKEGDKATWRGGREYCFVPFCSGFAQEAEALGFLPILTGPSGTTDSFLHMAKYLGMGDRLADGALACAAWMVPVGDHSLHEVRMIEPVYGMPYRGMPEDFAHYHSPAVQTKIDEALAVRKVHNPSYYFSADYQHIVNKQLDEEAAVKARAFLTF